MLLLLNNKLTKNMRKERFKVFVSVHLLFIEKDKILLLRRKNITSDGLYSVVAGHLDGGETVTQAMIREAKEETGIDIKPEDIDTRTVCHSYSNHNNKNLFNSMLFVKDGGAR